jgi:hypothetical protein
VRHVEGCTTIHTDGPCPTPEETLDERANRLAREAIKQIADLHTVKQMAAKMNWHCRHCLTMWPCPTISLLSEAEEAINEAEEVTTDGTLT